MNENAITARLIKHMNGIPGCFARKRHGGRFSSGDPDIAGVIDGRAFFVEVKLAGGGLSKLQAVMLDNWRRSGAYTSVVVYNGAAQGLLVTTLIGTPAESGQKWMDRAGSINMLPTYGMLLENYPVDRPGMETWMQSIIGGGCGLRTTGQRTAALLPGRDHAE